MLEGRYHNVQAANGRFRDYLKTCLFKLVADYSKRQARGRMSRLPEGYEPADHRAAPEAAEETWRQSWRQDLIDRTLEALRRLDQGKARFLYPVLRFHIDRPELSS
jgi:hypothetical protein